MLWEALVKNLPPKNAENMPDDPRKYITEYEPRNRGDRSIFRRLLSVQFYQDEEMKEHNGGLSQISTAGVKQ